MGTEPIQKNWFERCFMAWIAQRQSKLNFQRVALENYELYKNIGNLIFIFLCSNTAIADKPQSVSEIMDDAHYSYSTKFFFCYKWGYRGTTSGHMQSALKCFLSSRLRCSILVTCTESEIIVRFKQN